MKPERILAALLFADVKGYSELSEPQLLSFAEHGTSLIAEAILGEEPVYVNTWGDAVAVSNR
jgi:hypothetical protein